MNKFKSVFAVILLILCCKLEVSKEIEVKDESCGSLTYMLISNILSKKALPENYGDAYKLFLHSGTGLNDLGDYSGCKKLSYGKYYQITLKSQIFSQSIGLCYFKKCNESLIQDGILKALEGLNMTNITGSIGKDDISVINPDNEIKKIRDKYFVKFIISISIIGILFLFCLYASFSKNKTLESFDLFNNAKTIFKISNENKIYEHLRVFDGVRFLSAAWIVFGHLSMFSVTYVKNVFSFFYLF